MNRAASRGPSRGWGRVPTLRGTAERTLACRKGPLRQPSPHDFVRAVYIYIYIYLYLYIYIYIYIERERERKLYNIILYYIILYCVQCTI